MHSKNLCLVEKPEDHHVPCSPRVAAVSLLGDLLYLRGNLTGCRIGSMIKYHKYMGEQPKTNLKEILKESEERKYITAEIQKKH